MILIEKDGERQLVQSLDGYPDWNVVAKNVSPPPHDFYHWEKGKWVEDTEAKVEAERLAKIEAMSKAELLELMEQRTAEIARSAELKG